MTDSFGNDFLRIMRSKNNPEAFPRMDYEYNLAERDYEASRNIRIIDRVQIQFAEGQHAFLLRHPTRYHWCGYIHSRPEVWEEHRTEIESVVGHGTISYAFPSFEPICWMVRNINGFLKKPVDINPDGDFFLGFEMSALVRELSMDVDYALERLKLINDRIQAFNDYPIT
jgi:hypothetical protein